MAKQKPKTREQRRARRAVIQAPRRAAIGPNDYQLTDAPTDALVSVRAFLVGEVQVTDEHMADEPKLAAERPALVAVANAIAAELRRRGAKTRLVALPATPMKDDEG